jgi:hypothetical protein
MNRQDRAQREKRMTARRLAKAQRARDRGHRTGGVANHAVVTQPLDAAQRFLRYLAQTGLSVTTAAQDRRVRHKEGHVLAMIRR